MGRPRKFDRDAAVDTAMREIWKNGAGAVSAKALAERLGITRSSFYNAFGSRDRLIREALARYFGLAPDRMLEDIGTGDEVLVRLTAVFREICRVRAADPEAKGCLAVNAMAGPDLTDGACGPVLEEAVQAGLARFQTLLRQAARQGELEATADLRETALALQTLLVGLNLMSRVVRSEEELWAGAKRTLEGLGVYRDRGESAPPAG